MTKKARTDWQEMSIADLEEELDRRDALRLKGEAYDREETKQVMAVRNDKIREENRLLREDAAQLVRDGLEAREKRKQQRAQAGVAQVGVKGHK